MRSRRNTLLLTPAVIALACGGDNPEPNASGTSGITSLTGGEITGDFTSAPTDSGLTSEGPTTGASTGAPVEDDAMIVAATLPTALACNQAFAAEVVVRNTGLATWTRDAGYKLGTVDDSDPFYPGDTRVWLPDGVVVAPGAEHAFSFDLKAPATPGDYVTDWQMVHEGIRWFGESAVQPVTVSCDPADPGKGLVRLEGRAMVDDDGPFNALGATVMWAAWAYKFDRPRLEQNLAFLRDHGFDYIRALGVVGDYEQPDYWDGREIDWHWPDYADVIAGLTDLAYDGYGLRVEWTLIGDGQKNIPSEADRYALVDTFVQMAAARPGKIIHFELANEAWQNGFAGDDGLQQLRALTSTMRDATDILVAASAPAGVYCEDAQAIYAGGVADLATIHFDRDIGKVEGPWRPVRQPWEHQFCADLPVGTNNEPIGPGSSVAEENDPVRLVAAAITTYVSGLPAYVYHTNAGVRGDQNLWEMPGADAFVHLRALLPPGLSAWQQQNAHWNTAPFIVYAGESGVLYPDTMWVDLGDPESGVVRAYGAIQGQQFVVFPIGILNKVILEPRRPMHFDVIDPMTAAVVTTQDLGPGQQFELAGAPALLIKGAFTD